MRIGPALAAALALSCYWTCYGCNSQSDDVRPKQGKADEAIEIALPEGSSDAAFDQALSRVAKKHADGWEPAGPPIHGTLRQGTRSDHLLVLRGAHCYRVLAVAADGVSDLDLLLFDPNGVQVQQDPAQDRFPTLGMQTEICPVVGGAYRLQAVMYKGSGAFAARAYEIAS
jgi:hypothetical protein